MSDRPNLLPCPFCGSVLPFRLPLSQWVQCNDCGACAPSDAAWNMRPEAEWQPIETAKPDGSLVWVYVAAYDGLPAFQAVASYHPDTGWCVDELRDVTHWMPLRDVWLEPPND